MQSKLRLAAPRPTPALPRDEGRRLVVRAGILARGALYFCKTVGGQAVCDEQSDWHLLRERSGRLSFRTRKHFMLP